jgi:hypothetical protein
MSRYWISWYETAEDHRPLTYPPNVSILGWWCSGYRCSDDAATICALVEAKDSRSAHNAIVKDWPGDKDWRFTDEVDSGWIPSDRFPVEEWMKERVGDGKPEEK